MMRYPVRESHMGQGKRERQREGENEFCGRDEKLKDNRGWEMEGEWGSGKRAEAETGVREGEIFRETRLTKMPKVHKQY